MQAQFITLDGIDGAGKTTQLNVIREWFARHELPVLFTREPGGSELGECLREILLNPQSQIGIAAETLIMFAARAQHLEETIYPALKKGIHVVSDRFTDATFAYQGAGRLLGGEKIEALETWVQGDFRPNLTLLLDVPLDISLTRLEKSRIKDRFEQESAAFYQRVRAAYQERAEAHPQRYCIINSNQDKAIVKQEIEALLNQHFAKAT